MSRRQRHTPVFAALVALFLGLFLLGPMVDLVTCGPETGAAETSLSADAPCDVDGDGPAHGCAHGHCHSPATLPPLGAETPAIRTAPGALIGARDPTAAPATPDSLSRPPRI